MIPVAPSRTLGLPRRTETAMAAKRTIHPPRPNLDKPWSELTKAQQNQLYTKALHDYATGNGPNPTTSTAFARAKAAEEAKG